jgi:predicted dehydrogenase
MAKVRVGLVGCGFVAELHMYAYKRVYGLDAAVTAVVARGEHVLDFAKKHQIRATYRSAICSPTTKSTLSIYARPPCCMRR